MKTETRTHNRDRRRWRTLLTGVLIALALAGITAAGAAAYTSPWYPASRLSLHVKGKPRVGRMTTIVARGGNRTDMPGGLMLMAFAKRPQLDPTCSKTYTGEVAGWQGNPSESLVYSDSNAENSVGRFRIPMKIAFRRGPVLVCAYSVYITDTAASDGVRFRVHR
jgi:hypothetical protein